VCSWQISPICIEPFFRSSRSSVFRNFRGCTTSCAHYSTILPQYSNTQYHITHVRWILIYVEAASSSVTTLARFVNTQNVSSIFTLYIANYSGFRSTAVSRVRWQNWRLKYDQGEVHSIGYLFPSVSDYAPTKQLRSSSQYLLNEPAVRT